MSNGISQSHWIESAQQCLSFCCDLQHSQHCGAATGIFLLINASVIIIIRGHRFCLWGSVYLDAHGEEDRDLRYITSHHTVQTFEYSLAVSWFHSTYLPYTLFTYTSCPKNVFNLSELMSPTDFRIKWIPLNQKMKAGMKQGHSSFYCI